MFVGVRRARWTGLLALLALFYISAPKSTSPPKLRLVARPSGFALSLLHREQLSLLLLNESGRLEAPPRLIAPNAKSADMAASESRLAVVWTEPSGGAHRMFVQVIEPGAMSAPTLLQTHVLGAPRIVGTEHGFAVVWYALHEGSVGLCLVRLERGKVPRIVRLNDSVAPGVLALAHLKGQLGILRAETELVLTTVAADDSVSNVIIEGDRAFDLALSAQDRGEGLGWGAVWNAGEALDFSRVARGCASKAKRLGLGTGPDLAFGLNGYGAVFQGQNGPVFVRLSTDGSRLGEELVLGYGQSAAIVRGPVGARGRAGWYGVAWLVQDMRYLHFARIGFEDGIQRSISSPLH